MLYTHCKQKHARQQNFSNDILWWKLHDSEYHAMMHLVAAFVSTALCNQVPGTLPKIRHHRRTVATWSRPTIKTFYFNSLDFVSRSWMVRVCLSLPIVIRCISTNCALEDEILWFFIVAMTCKSNSVSLLCHQTELDKSVIVVVKCRASDRGSRKGILWSTVFFDLWLDFSMTRSSALDIGHVRCMEQQRFHSLITNFSTTIPDLLFACEKLTR